MACMCRVSAPFSSICVAIEYRDTDIAALLAELDGHDREGADWIRDNGELYLAGDWLTRCGLLGQSLNIELLPGKMIIRVEFGVILA
ncbi:hypothetical protein DDT54_22265 [Brenneria nigrifluens DSM 30175 = ATCC 13028]|nr:hypothetical protein DDT54_22265 [Brenneria nigrifluens DSM 30175 = ATCC 13028]